MANGKRGSPLLVVAELGDCHPQQLTPFLALPKGGGQKGWQDFPPFLEEKGWTTCLGFLTSRLFHSTRHTGPCYIHRFSRTKVWKRFSAQPQPPQYSSRQVATSPTELFPSERLLSYDTWKEKRKVSKSPLKGQLCKQVCSPTSKTMPSHSVWQSRVHQHVQTKVQPQGGLEKHHRYCFQGSSFCTENINPPDKTSPAGVQHN